MTIDYPVSHYMEVCEYGIKHNQCRCPIYHKTVRHIECDRPNEHEQYAPTLTEQEQLKQRPNDQPLPQKNESTDIQSLVIEDIKERRELGISRYGTALQADNGRSMLQDAYEEAIDLTVYLRGIKEEERGNLEAQGCRPKDVPSTTGKPIPICDPCSEKAHDYVKWNGHTVREAKLLTSLAPAIKRGMNAFYDEVEGPDEVEGW